MNTLTRWLVTAGFILLMPLVQAAEATKAVELNKADIERWLEAMPKLTNWLSQHEDKLGADDVVNGSDSMDQVFDKGVQQLKKVGLYGEFNKKVTAAGYKNVEQWAAISQGITMAYMAVEMEKEQVSESQMLAQLEQVRNAEGLSAEEKAMMEQMMKASMMMVTAAQKVSPKSKDAIRPFVDRISKQFDEQQEHDLH